MKSRRGINPVIVSENKKGASYSTTATALIHLAVADEIVADLKKRLGSNLDYYDN